MRFAGRIFRSGRHWAVEVPDLGVYTQGTSRASAHAMAAEALEIMVDRPDFKASVFPGKGGYFEIGGNDAGVLVALLLRQRRASSGLSLSEVARRLGVKSRNAYARYEQGRAIPTIQKLVELLAAIDPTREVVIAAARA